MSDLDGLRLATALVVSVPSVTLTLRTAGHGRLIVAHGRLDADLSPCALRASVAAERRSSTGLVERIASVDVTAGLDDLGGGLYRRLDGGVEERWFVTTAPLSLVNALLDESAPELPDNAMHASMRFDTELATTVVRITATNPLFVWRLDDAAVRAVAACMVAELTQAATAPS